MKASDIINISSFVGKCYDLYSVQRVSVFFCFTKLRFTRVSIVIKLSYSLFGTPLNKITDSKGYGRNKKDVLRGLPKTGSKTAFSG